LKKEGVLLFLKMRSITSQGGRLRKKGIEIVEKNPYCSVGFLFGE